MGLDATSASRKFLTVPRLAVRPAAPADHVEIADFLSPVNQERAASRVAEIEAEKIQTAERPGSVPARDGLRIGPRSARHGRYLNFFPATSDELQIVRVLHGARDLTRLFRS